METVCPKENSESEHSISHDVSERIFHNYKINIYYIFERENFQNIYID